MIPANKLSGMVKTTEPTMLGTALLAMTALCACQSSEASTSPGCKFVRDAEGCWQQRLAEAASCAATTGTLEAVDHCSADSIVYELERDSSRSLPDAITARSGDEVCFEALRMSDGFQLSTSRGAYAQRTSGGKIVVECSDEPTHDFASSDFDSCAGELPSFSQQQKTAGGEYSFALSNLQVICTAP